MATNALTYIRNVGKSTGYIVIDAFKELNPSITSFAESNEDFVKDVYNATKDIKKTIRNIQSKTMKSPYVAFADDFRKNFIDDLKTGNFYNRERIAKAEKEFGKSMGMDFDEDFDDNFNFDDFDYSDDSYFMADNMDSVGAKIANANAEASFRSADYIVHAQKESTKVIDSKLNLMLEKSMMGVNAINSTLVNVQANTSGTLSAMNQSNAIMSSVLEEHKKTNELLERIIRNQEEVMPKKNDISYRETKDYDYVVDSNGMPNLKKYSELVIDNLKEQFSLITSMNDMISGMGGDDGGLSMLKQFSASPISMLSKAGIKTILDKTIGKFAEEFNETLQGFFGSSIMKLNKLQKSDSPILSALGRIFGINTSIKTSMNTSGYEKGAVAFDGKTRKSIIEVIPTYLSQIVSLLGGPNTRYDFDRGVFVTAKEIRQKNNDIVASNARIMSSDIRRDFDDYAKQLNFSDSEKEKFNKTMDTFFQELLKSGEMFDYNGKDIHELAKKYKIDDQSMYLIVSMFRANKDRGLGHKAMKLNGNIMSSRSRLYKEYDRLEKDGDNILLNLFNNSGLDIKDATKNPLNPLNVLDDLGHNQFFYLQNYYSDLKEIVDIMRNNNFGGSVSGNGPKSNGPNGPVYGNGFIMYGDQDNFANHTKYSVPNNYINFEEEREKAKKAEEEKKKKEKEKKLRKIHENHEKFYKEHGGKNKVNIALATTQFGKDEYEESFEYKNKISLEDIARESTVFNDIAAQQNLANQFVVLANDRKAIEEERRRRDGMFQRLRNANSLSEKGVTILESIDTLAKAPVKVLANILHKADLRMYELIYGKDGNASDPEDKSFFRQMMDNMKTQFQKLNDWIDEHILTPLEDKMNKAWTSISEWAKPYLDKISNKLFGEIGEDGRRSGGLFGDFIQDTKDEFKNVGKYIKDSFGYVFEDLFGQYLQKYKKTPETTALSVVNPNQVINNTEAQEEKFAEMFGKYASDRLQKENRKINSIAIEDKVTEAIKAQQSKLALPDKDEEDNDPLDVTDSAKGWTQDPETGEWIPGFAKGGKVRRTGLAAVTKGELIVPFFGKYSEGTKGAGEEAETESVRSSKTQYDFGALGADIAKEVGSGVKYTFNRLFGKDDNDSNEKFNQMIDDLGENARKYLPAITTGGIIGAGASLVGGVIGGPLVGAAIGAAAGLIKRSDKVQNWLFGEENKDGKMEGGVLGTKISTFLKKQFPDMAKYGTVGAITSLMPFIPGGPVAGLIVGSGIGFLKHSEKVQNFLFNTDNSEGILHMNKEEFNNKISKALPKIGAGAAVGLLAGPFGLVPNLVLGSAAGFATSTNKFQTFMFGEEDENGERHGGLIDDIRDGVIEPLKNFASETSEKLKNWFNEKIVDPISSAIEPIIRQVEITIKGGIKSLADRLFDTFNTNIGVPLRNFVEAKIIKPFTNVFTTVFKFLLKPAKWAIQAPAALIGKVGKHLRKNQIKGGYANYMTAQERIDFREDNHMGFGDKFANFDEALTTMNVEDMQVIKSALAYINDPNKASRKENKDAQRSVRDALFSKDSGLSYDQSKKLFKTFKQGRTDRVVRDLGNLGIKDENLINLINTNGEIFNKSSKQNMDTVSIQDKAQKILKKYGIKDIEFGKGSNVWKYQDILNKEIDYRNSNKFKEDEEKNDNTLIKETRKFHSDIFKPLHQIVSLLRKATGVANEKDDKEIFNYRGMNKKEKNDRHFNVVKSFLSNKDENLEENNEEQEVQNYAQGTRMVKNTGLAVLTKGEMVIPVEQNPYYHGHIDSKTTQKSKEDNVIRKFLAEKGIKFFGKYNEGTEAVVDAEATDIDVKDGKPVDSDDNVKGLAKVKNKIQDFTDYGIISYKKDKSGDLKEDLSDSGTKEALKKREEHEGRIDKINNYLENINSKLLSNIASEGTKTKESLWDRLKNSMENIVSIAIPAAILALGNFVSKLDGVSEKIQQITDKFSPIISKIEEILGLDKNDDGSNMSLKDKAIELGETAGIGVARQLGKGKELFIPNKALQSLYDKALYLRRKAGQAGSDALNYVGTKTKDIIKNTKDNVVGKYTNTKNTLLDTLGKGTKTNKQFLDEVGSITNKDLIEQLTSSNGVTYSLDTADRLLKMAEASGDNILGDTTFRELFEGGAANIDDLFDAAGLNPNALKVSSMTSREAEIIQGNLKHNKFRDAFKETLKDYKIDKAVNKITKTELRNAKKVPISDRLGLFGKKAKDIITHPFKSTKNAATSITDTMSSGMFTNIGDSLKKNMVDETGEIVGSLGTAIKSVFEGVINTHINHLTKIGEVLTAPIKLISETAGGKAFMNLIEETAGIIGLKVTKGKAGLLQVVDITKAAKNKVGDVIKNSPIYKGLDAFRSVMSNTGKALGELGENIADTIDLIIPGFKERTKKRTKKNNKLQEAIDEVKGKTNKKGKLSRKNQKKLSKLERKQNKVSKQLNRANSDILEEVASKEIGEEAVQRTGMDLVEEAAQKVTKETTESITKEASEKILAEAGQEAAEKALKEETEVGVKKGLFGIWNKLKSKIPGNLQKPLEKAMEETAGKVGKEAAQNGGKLAKLGKGLRGLAIPGPADIPFAIADFISGYQKASAIWGINSADEEFKLTKGQRAIAGLVNALLGISIITMFVDKTWLINVMVKYAGKYIGVEQEELKAAQERAQEALAAYNADPEHQDHQLSSLEDYNKEVNGEKSVFDQIKESEIGQAITNAVSVAGAKIKDGVVVLWNALKEIGPFIKDKAIQIFKQGTDQDYDESIDNIAEDDPLGGFKKGILTVMNLIGVPIKLILRTGTIIYQAVTRHWDDIKAGFAKVKEVAFEPIKDMLVAAWNGDLDAVNEKIQAADANSDESVAGCISQIAMMIVGNVSIIFGGIMKVIRGIKDNIVPVTKKIFTGIKHMGQDVANAIKYAWEGNIEGYFDFDEANSDDTEASSLQVIFRVATRVLLSPITGTLFVFGRIASAVSKIVEKIKSATGNDEYEAWLTSVEKGESKFSWSEYWSGMTEGDDGEGVGALTVVLRGITRVLYLPIMGVKVVFNKVKNAVTNAIDTVKTAFQDILQLFGFGGKSSKDGAVVDFEKTGTFSKIVSGIKTVINFITKIVSTTVKFAGNLVTGGVKAIGKVFSTIGKVASVIVDGIAGVFSFIGNVVGTVVKAVKSVVGFFTGKSGKENQENMEAVADGVDSYARGTHMVQKTGLAVLTKGEMVVPVEQNPYYHGPIDSKEEQIRKEQSIIDKFKKSKTKTNLPFFGNYAEGGVVGENNQGDTSLDDSDSINESDVTALEDASNIDISKDDAMETAKNGIKKAFDIITMPVKFVKTVISTVFDKVKTAFDGISDKFRSIIDGVKTNFSDVAKCNAELSKLAYQGDTDSISKYDIEISEDNPFGGIVKIPLNITKGVYYIIGFFKSIFNKLFGFVGEFVDKIKDGATDFIKNIDEKIEDIPVLGDAYKGIKNGVSTVKDKVSGGINWLKDKIGWGSGLVGGGSGVDEGFVSQLDPRIKNTKFNSTQDTINQTIGTDGCAPAVATMAINKATGKNIDINTAANYALNNGYKEKNSGTKTEYFKDILSQYGVNSNYIDNKDIENNLRSGNSVILLGTDNTNSSKKNSPFGPRGHYVLATGMDKNGNIIVNDPEATSGGKVYNKNILDSVTAGIGVNSNGNGKEIHGVGSSNAFDTDTARSVWGYFTSKGYSNEATAGIMGNLYQESGVDPTKIQSNGNGPGAGIAQWEDYRTKSGRWKALNNLATKNGKDWKDLDTQLTFMENELTSNDINNRMLGKTGSLSSSGAKAMAYNDWKSSKDLENATRLFEGAYERAGKPEMSNRLKYAKNYYNLYSGSEYTGIYNGNTSNTQQNSGLIGELSNAIGNNEIATILSEASNVSSAITTDFAKTTAAELFGMNSSSNENINTSNLTGADKVIAIAMNEIGYCEKASNDNLDDKKANAGKNNYTKYWRDLGYRHGQPWCNAFVNWCFVQAYGKQMALKLLCCNTFSYYTPVSSGYFKKANRWSNTPMKGDIIYFKNSSRISHVGIVIKVEGNKVYTVEGNTGGGNNIVENDGGCVNQKSYDINNSRIAGYGHPDYSLVSGSGSGIKKVINALNEKLSGSGSNLPFVASQKINTGSMKIHRRLNKLNSSLNTNSEILSRITPAVGSGSGLCSRISKYVLSERTKKDDKIKSVSGSGTIQMPKVNNVITNKKNSTIIKQLGEDTKTNVSKTSGKINNIDLTSNNEQVIALLKVIVEKLSNVVDNTTLINTIVTILKAINSNKGSGTTNGDKTTGSKGTPSRSLLLNGSSNNMSIDKNMQELLEQLTVLASQ